MKIFWLHDWRLKEYLGGAQITTAEMLLKAPSEVEMVYPDTFSRRRIGGYPLILSNTGLFRKSDLKWIAETQKYIKYERDYSFCKRRHATAHDCLTECSDTLSFYTELFQNSILNIFLSPLHANVYLKYMPLDRDKVHIQPSPINVDRFRCSKDKEDFYLAVGESGWHKGIDLIEKELIGKNFVFIGGENKISYDELPNWYKKAKYFIHKPRWIEPFGRTVAEAYCADCILLVNNKIGFLSYSWDYSDRGFVYDQLKNAPRLFWNRVIECLK